MFQLYKEYINTAVSAIFKGQFGVSIGDYFQVVIGLFLIIATIILGLAFIYLIGNFPVILYYKMMRKINSKVRELQK